MASFVLYFMLLVHINSSDIEERAVNFGVDDLTVVLSWPQKLCTSYSVSIVPRALHTSNVNASAIEIRLSYNVEYTVNIILASTYYGGNNLTTMIGLKYGELINS